MVYLLKIVIFYSYVKLPEGTHFLFPVNPLNFRWTLEFPGGQVHMVTRQRKLLDMDKRRQFGAVNL